MKCADILQGVQVVGDALSPSIYDVQIKIRGAPVLVRPSSLPSHLHPKHQCAHIPHTCLHDRHTLHTCRMEKHRMLERAGTWQRTRPARSLQHAPADGEQAGDAAAHVERVGFRGLGHGHAASRRWWRWFCHGDVKTKMQIIFI